MIYLILIPLLGLAFGGGVAAGITLRGRIPLRAPANKVRVENAKTDVQIAEAALERRRLDRQIAQEEMELEGDQIKGSAAIAELRAKTEAAQLALEATNARPELAVVEVLTTRRAELLISFAQLEEILKRAGRPIARKRLAQIEAGDGATDSELRLLSRELDLDYTPPRVSRPNRIPKLPYHDRDRLDRERLDREAQDRVEALGVGS